MNDITRPGHTKLWHAVVERAIQTAQQSGEPFTVEAVLNSIGILSWAPYRSQAFAYANKMLDPDQKANYNEPTKE